jgi:hypothetical protein
MAYHEFNRVDRKQRKKGKKIPPFGTRDLIDNRTFLSDPTLCVCVQCQFNVCLSVCFMNGDGRCALAPDDEIPAAPAHVTTTATITTTTAKNVESIVSTRPQRSISVNLVHHCRSKHMTADSKD